MKKSETKENTCIGSNFDDFLKEEGILNEVTTNAIKKVVQTQDHSPERPGFVGNLGFSFDVATGAANYWTHISKVYCCAIPNPNPQWSVVQGKSWVVSNCYHPFK